MAGPFRTPWSSQPPPTAKSVYPGLLWLSSGASPDVVKGGVGPTISGAFSKAAGQGGVCVKGPSSQTTGNATWSSSISIAASQDYTILVFCTPSTDTGNTVPTHNFPGAQSNTISITASGIAATLDNNGSGTVAWTGPRRPMLFMAQRKGNRAYAYVPSGASINGVTGTRAQSITSVVAGQVSTNNVIGCETYYTAVIGRAISLPEYMALVANPWQIFAAPQRVLFGAAAAGGGTTYNDSVTEAATASESSSATVDYAASASESATASDSPSASASFVVSLTESASASETSTATGGSQAASITEAASASDSWSAAALYVASLTEAATASDATDASINGNVWSVSITESAAAGDAWTSTATLIALAVESAFAQDVWSYPGDPISPYRGNYFDFPSNANVLDEDGTASRSWQQWFNRINTLNQAAAQAGPTSARPVKNLWVGRRFFDSTLGKPIYVKTVNPAVWVDGIGTIC